MRGIKVPALGSPRDRVYRDYLVHEQRTEAKKQELALYIAMGSMPAGSDKRQWFAGTKRTFDAYVSLLWGIEPQEHTAEERKLLDYYSKVVKKSQVIVHKNADGNIEASGDIIDFLRKE